MPRASKLAQLGVSFWLGLWPIVLGLFAVTGVLYGVSWPRLTCVMAPCFVEAAELLTPAVQF